MVERAQQTAIAVASGAEITFPEFDVMRVGPVRRPIASRPSASLISCRDGPANVCWECSRRSSDIKDLGLGAQDHRDDLRIAQVPSGLGGADHRTGVETGV